MSFQLSSNSFAEGGWIPELPSYKGAGLSLSLDWSGELGDVHTFMLVVEDQGTGLIPSFGCSIT
ncbi:MAG: hypothetical protein ABSB88_06740 [Bryobacteraceae bacterium]|jgi:phosphatidylethanolamine-binding protein (PEBP) family uncharacterized protein